MLGKRGLKHRIGFQFAIEDGFIDARQILIHDAPGPEIEMADLAVSHLAIRQSDIHPTGAQSRHRRCGIEGIVERRFGKQGGIPVGLRFSAPARIDAPPVANDKNNWFRHGWAPSFTTASAESKKRSLLRGGAF